MSKPERVAKLETETYLFVCLDGPESASLREDHLFGHLAHIETHHAHYRVAGPMRNTPDGPIVGSFFLMAAKDEKAAREVMQGDPYINSDMFASITVHQITPACGQWMGGIIWDQDEIRANMKKYT